jgi:hypothetical protein
MAEHAAKCADRPFNTIDVLLDDLKPAMCEDDQYANYAEIEMAYFEMTDAMHKFHSLVYAQCHVARERCTMEERMEVILNEEPK